MPSPVLLFHTILPVLRSMQIAWSDLFWASMVEVKTLSPMTTGVDALGPGMSRVHCAPSLLNSAGRFFSSVKPLKFGPRHWGQSAASVVATAATSDNIYAIRFMAFSNSPCVQTLLNRERIRRKGESSPAVSGVSGSGGGRLVWFGGTRAAVAR